MDHTERLTLAGLEDQGFGVGTLAPLGNGALGQRLPALKTTFKPLFGHLLGQGCWVLCLLGLFRAPSGTVQKKEENEIKNEKRRNEKRTEQKKNSVILCPRIPHGFQ